MTDASGGYPPGAGPAGRVPAEDELLRIVAGQQLGVLAVIKSDGRPHLSNVAYAWDPAERVARVSTVAGRAKVRLLRNDPRCSLHIGETVLRYAVAEAEAELSPVSEAAGDATGLELLRMSPEFDTPESRSAFLDQMVKDRRMVLRLRVSRLYGLSIDLP
ncbi:TIGR03618 family F420-dependent PPOX class oxidoreductase [Streptomyces sp. NBC_01477]|uniref:TIGR03618 family F420-dependent PPOX class oxidoreductase n=1 Tax=Streptomyces sp. NBC_01477 TaxID=2976015 RepID=UPI002E34A0DD|nr:TIGR03618 family F420-dependent PPOX class oxidoreductase [Streptomyces sp. NBC_01477]